GQRVGFHVYGLDNFFHTFHLHGHRWKEPDGSIVDTKPFGPADSFRLEFVEDNPGRWFYHCHVFTHFHMGMNGWYIVD
ncbi:MAG: multicopper oxidase domain-containing protein, partial [Actinobacteria bacterium]|nr:multicopper oxidase domain-containing protein [Actinomycetota bacterium]